MSLRESASRSITVDRNRASGKRFTRRVFDALVRTSVFSVPDSGVMPPSPRSTSSESRSTVTSTAAGSSPSHSTVACQDRTAMVSRWPIRAAVPVTPVCSSNSPSEASKVHALNC